MQANLDVAGLEEMTADEARETNGGFWPIVVAIAFVAGIVAPKIFHHFYKRR